tara:strand:- start:3510 stop:4520 length:1011 start_codon:yes stop_codon:yes gene_type:complete
LIKTHTIFGIGNPLIDIVINVQEEDLIKLEMNKGTMDLVSGDRQMEIIKYFKGTNILYSPGGSAPNTIIACSGLGIDSFIQGKIGNDKFGSIYLDQIKNCDVRSGIIQSDGATGSSIVLVTPDGERTMNTHLGLCRDFSADDLDIDTLAESKYLYFTGYMWDTETQKSALKKAISVCKKNDVKIVFDVADPFVVNRNRLEFLDMLRNSIDIVFANKPEMEILFNNKKIENSIKKIMQYVTSGAIKLGKEGAIVFNNDVHYRTLARPVEVLDTTGAGDMFAAGFLSSLTRKVTLDKAGKIATYLAGEIIKVNGAQINKKTIEKIKEEVFSPHYEFKF